MEAVEGFATRIRNLRKEYGYKMLDVAKILDVSLSTISTYEIGTWVPTLSGLVKLEDLYHCSTDYLLGRDDKKPEVSAVDIRLNVLKQKLNELEELVQKSK